jgi:hypothetical protein
MTEEKFCISEEGNGFTFIPFSFLKYEDLENVIFEKGKMKIT